MNSRNSVIASKNWTLNVTAAARKKIDGGVTGQLTTSDSIDIRLSKSPKLDGAGVYSVRTINPTHKTAEITFVRT